MKRTFKIGNGHTLTVLDDGYVLDGEWVSDFDATVLDSVTLILNDVQSAANSIRSYYARAFDVRVRHAACVEVATYVRGKYKIVEFAPRR